MARVGGMAAEVAVGEFAHRVRWRGSATVGARKASGESSPPSGGIAPCVLVVRTISATPSTTMRSSRCGVSIVTTCVTLPYGSTCSSRSPGDDHPPAETTRWPGSVRGVSFSDWML